MRNPGWEIREGLSSHNTGIDFSLTLSNVFHSVKDIHLYVPEDFALKGLHKLLQLIRSDLLHDLLIISQPRRVGPRQQIVFSISLSYVRLRTRFDMTCSDFGWMEKGRVSFLLFNEYHATSV